jgi:hypothetical protein
MIAASSSVKRNNRFTVSHSSHFAILFSSSSVSIVAMASTIRSFFLPALKRRASLGRRGFGVQAWHVRLARGSTF